MFYFKVFYFKLCKDKIHWDSPVSESVKEQWIKYLNNLKAVKSVAIERHLFCCEAPEKQLHGFCDSSGIAYSAVVFVRSVCEHGVKVRLWCAKTRLVPIKEENIPRLELLGCLLLSKLIKSVYEAVGGVVRLSEIYCWSDAQILFWWIKQTHKNWKVWVQNRVNVIRDNVAPARWFYVPTKINPADIATRITNPIKLVNNSLWWNGQNFLITEQLEIPN